MALAIRLDDITHMHCDAIVTATDTALSGTCGVDQDIHRAAGPELDAACRALAPCPVASAVCTDGYRLSRKIIHAVGPTWHNDPADLQTLAACYRAVFACAREARCASLAMPLISAGRLGFPPDDVLRIAVQEARAFLERCSIDIFIVTHRPSTFNLGVRMFAGSLERIHDKKMRFAAEHGTLSLDEVLGQQHESFRDMLLREIAARGMTNAACYQKAHVSKSVFSNIVKNGTIPKKPNVAALVFALELPLEDPLTLFGKAGYYLTNTDPFDTILEYFIEQGNYDLFALNEALYQRGQPPLWS